jgi:L-lactate dehydrogenase complex protein LldF
MSSTKAKEFQKESERKAFDLAHRKTIRFNMGKYDVNFLNGLKQFTNVEDLKQKVGSIKRTAIQDWDKYLLQFEDNVIKNGGEVFWAETGEDAVKEALRIIRLYEGDMLVKSKSMTTEEIEFNEFLEKEGIEIVETDLGEYIVQVAGEKPYHIVTPAMHKSKEDVAELFHKEFNLPIESTPEEITQYVREKLRKKYTTAKVGVTGGNFLVADVGGVALTENEGNGLMSTAFPKVHIAIVGIEKIIPKLTDLNYIWPLLASHGTGQQITSYSSVFTGGSRSKDESGPEKMYVILLDNGRTEMFQEKEQSRALNCIRCGACLNVCPIYKNIGGYTYESTYSGPIGSVITPHYKGFGVFKHLSFASTLCGKCTEVCPVKIDLHDLLLYNRKKAVESSSNFIWDTDMYGYKTVMGNRKALDLVNGKVANSSMELLMNSNWGKHKKMPKVAKQSFSKQYRKKK